MDVQNAAYRLHSLIGEWVNRVYEKQDMFTDTTEEASVNNGATLRDWIGDFKYFLDNHDLDDDDAA